MPPKPNTAYIGFDLTLLIDLSDVIATDVNLVDKKVICSIKKDRKLPDENAVLIKDFVVGATDLDSSNSQALIIAFTTSQMLTLSEEGTYYWDCKIFNADNTACVLIPNQPLEIKYTESRRLPT